MRASTRVVSAMLCVLAVLWGCAPDATERVPRDLRLEDLVGRWVLVNYWAIWCAPCRNEVPELNAIQRAHEDELVVLGVNFDAPAPEVNRAQARELGIEFPVLEKDPGPGLGANPPQALPVTLVVAPDGTLTHELVGPQTRASLEAILFGADQAD